MKKPIQRIRVRCSVLLALLSFAGAANAADAPREPLAVIGSLVQQNYVTGETTANAAAMIDAESKAAAEIRRYVDSGLTDGLLAAGKGKPSPLSVAVYMGYPNVVEALLASKLLRDQINDADEKGQTLWMSANFSMRQSSWICNPAVFQDPSRIVPMLVTQPYYLSNPTPPYKRTREVLEKAGAVPDLAKAKQAWLATCRNPSEDVRSKVQNSTDLQATLQELGKADLEARLSNPGKAQ